MAFNPLAKASKKKKGGSIPVMPLTDAGNTEAYNGYEDLKGWISAIEKQEGDEAQGERVTNSTTTARAYVAGLTCDLYGALLRSTGKPDKPGKKGRAAVARGR